jgi:Tfp pilus assembly protein PilX
MLRKLFTQIKQPSDRGFALPTVMIVAVVMMVILVTAVQASASVRTALSNQYYNNLASEAAEAGAIFANACIQKADGYASWSQLQPNTDCTGKAINGVMNRYLVNQSDMRSTFTVSNNPASTGQNDTANPYNLTISGSVQLLRKSAPDVPWKTINVKRKLQIQPCTKTVTNLIQNPSFEYDTSTWYGTNASIYKTTNAAAPPDVTNGANTLMVVPNNTSADSFAENSTFPNFKVGETYTVSGVLHVPPWGFNPSNGTVDVRRLSIVMYWIKDGVYQSATATTANTNPGHQRVSKTFTIPSGATNPFIRLYNGAGSSSGEIYWDSIMLTQGTTDYPYKDGNTPGWAWNGTFNNATSTGPVRSACTSASTCTPTNLITNPNFDGGTNNFTPGNSSLGPDSTWKVSGTNSLRITPNTSSGDSYASIGGDDGGLRLGMQPGKTYTVSGTVNVPSPQYLGGTVTYPWRRAGIVIHTWNPVSGWSFYTVNPAGAPNDNKHQFNSGAELTGTSNSYYSIGSGTYKLSTTFTVPTNGVTAFIRLYNGSTNAAPIPIVQWDNIALYEGTRAPYYDGDSPGWSWSGTPNLSTSSGPLVPCNAPITY